MYGDISDRWSFDDKGDLQISRNYRQSIKHRLLCPLHYLNIYYENYGSNLYQQLGERYNQDMVSEEIRNALEQDVNIYNYSINEITFIDGDLTLNLTINGDNIFFTYHIYDEINQFITVDSEIYINTENNYILKMIVNINDEMYIYEKNLSDIFEIENISYIDSYYRNEIIEIDLIINGENVSLKYDIEGNELKGKPKIITELENTETFIYNDNLYKIQVIKDGILCSNIPLEIYIDNEYYRSIMVYEGEAIVNLNDVSIGEHEVYVKSLETDKFYSNTSNVKLITVNKHMMNVVAEDLTVYKGTGSLLITQEVSSNNENIMFDGEFNVLFSVDGEIIEEINERVKYDDFLEIDISDFMSNDYDVTISWENYDDTIEDGEIHINVKILKIKTFIESSNIEMYVKENESLSGYVIDEFGNYITNEPIHINYKNYIDGETDFIETLYTNSNGEFESNKLNNILYYNNCYIDITFDENDEYESSIKTVNVKLNKYNVLIECEPNYIMYKDDTEYIIHLKTFKNGQYIPLEDNVKMLINSDEIEITTDSNGEGRFDLTDYECDLYECVIIYDGNVEYNSVEQEVDIEITKYEVNIIGETYIEGNEGSLNYNCYLMVDNNPLKNKHLTIKLMKDNQTITLGQWSDNTGKVTFNLNDIGYGLYDGLLIFDDEDMYYYKEKSITVKINRHITPIFNVELNKNGVIDVFTEDVKLIIQDELELNDLSGETVDIYYYDDDSIMTEDTKRYIGTVEFDENNYCEFDIDTTGTFMNIRDDGILYISYNGDDLYDSKTWSVPLYIGDSEAVLREQVFDYMLIKTYEKTNDGEIKEYRDIMKIGYPYILMIKLDGSRYGTNPNEDLKVNKGKAVIDTLKFDNNFDLITNHFDLIDFDIKQIDVYNVFSIRYFEWELETAMEDFNLTEEEFYELLDEGIHIYITKDYYIGKSIIIDGDEYFGLEYTPNLNDTNTIDFYLKPYPKISVDSNYYHSNQSLDLYVHSIDYIETTEWENSITMNLGETETLRFVFSDDNLGKFPNGYKVILNKPNGKELIGLVNEDGVDGSILYYDFTPTEKGTYIFSAENIKYKDKNGNLINTSWRSYNFATTIVEVV